jgi:hypothetical protein
MTVARVDAGMAPGRLVASGEIHAEDVSEIYEQAMAAAWAGRQTITLDLSRVTTWSVLAQAMIVGVARELARSQSSLVLVGASLGLRLQSQRVDVFTRVRAFSR